jgi:hypothetical protein
MKKLVMGGVYVLAVVACVWPWASHAAFETGSSLLAKCRGAGGRAPEVDSKASRDLASCYSYLAGVVDVLGLTGEICPSPVVTPRQLARIFVDFARVQPPAMLHHPALLFIQVPLERAFPCNRK